MTTKFIVRRKNDRDVKFVGELIGFSQRKTDLGENIESYMIYRTDKSNIVIERNARISHMDLVVVFRSSYLYLSSKDLEVFGFSDLAKEAYNQAGLDHYEHA